ncbi:hypothetical protein CKO44_07090 [Rubrivivax gelatinosus]|uniref:hypothetical protein n=1 Tax=Rubrivivax gelatinosus TaxID=28068 RepID=UPI001903913C|nr:hypothetical protein [Rubrivivax gelatinosus]MBK1613236.1 hypothetical protein [Rubrivivax gelatinosus]
MRPARTTLTAAAPRRIGAAFALVLALLTAQWLGLAHTVLHAGGTNAATVAAAAADGPRGGLESLFAGHGKGSGDCRLYDQLGHAEPIPPAAVVTAALLPCPPQALPYAARLALAEGAPYAARGPPPRG